MVKAGDILKLEKPLYPFEQKKLDEGGYYVVVQYHKMEIYQNADGVWGAKYLEELEPPRIALKTHNGIMVHGELSDYDIKFEVVGRIER